MDSPDTISTVFQLAQLVVPGVAAEEGRPWQVVDLLGLQWDRLGPVFLARCLNRFGDFTTATNGDFSPNNGDSTGKRKKW